ncbi:MAG: DNA-binding protein [Pedobacter sp.]|nr:MAG: DNA-binding protein [Pedobacter sp.]
MKTLTFLVVACLTFLYGTANAQSSDTTKRYIRVPTGYLMVLRQGDHVFAEIEKMATAENIPAATFTGMGFVNAKFGFFNFKTKEYAPKEFKDMELASMTGSVAWQDGKASLHIHGVVTGKDFKAYGGHLLDATVSTGSLEIMVNLLDKPLKRIKEEPLGANVLQLNP